LKYSTRSSYIFNGFLGLHIIYDLSYKLNISLMNKPQPAFHQKVRRQTCSEGLWRFRQQTVQHSIGSPIDWWKSPPLVYLPVLFLGNSSTMFIAESSQEYFLPTGYQTVALLPTSQSGDHIGTEETTFTVLLCTHLRNGSI